MGETCIQFEALEWIKLDHGVVLIMSAGNFF